MTERDVAAPDLPTPTGLRPRMRSLLVLALVVVVGVVALAAGFGVGQRQATAQWQSGTAYVGDEVFTVTSGDWSYGASDGIAMWLDQAGSVHEGGWPDCLAALSGQEVVIRFAAARADLDQMGLRPIVAVDCRGTSAAPPR